MEGSSNNKAIEIWNHTGAPVDLTGILADNDAYVVVNSGAGAPLLAFADLTSGGLTFNGDVNRTDVFDPSIEWDGFALDTFDGLGTHAEICGPVPAAPSTWGSLKSLYR